MKVLLKLVYGIKVNLAIQEQQLIILYQVRQRKQLRLERFAKRPYRVEGDLELERPIVTVGDVPNRAALERAADKMSADGVIFNNVYDNGYSNNQVIFSLRDDLKNGRVFKKGAKPLEKSQFIDTGTSMNGDLDINKNIQNFVEYLLNPETQQRIASIDAELGTKYGEAAKRFVDRYTTDNN